LTSSVFIRHTEYVISMSILDQPAPHINIVKKHAALLIGQAILLVILATFYVGFEVKASLLEASVPKDVMSPLVADTTDDNAVLGAEAAASPTPEPAIIDNQEAVAPIEQPTPTATPFPKPSKEEYTIAVYGDSMEDTMGEVLEYLEHELTARYPDTKFNLYNYGMGSNNVLDGMARFNRPFVYQDRDYRSLKDIKPDIIIMGSFGYNVLTPHDRNAHWLGLTRLVEEAEKITPTVYMLAEIAPKRRGFGFGPNGVNWEPATAFEHTGKIMEQLENAIGLSSALHVPLIDAYTPSLQENKREGKSELINPSDGIHPSVEGHEFTAKIIADTIQLP